MGPGGVLIFSKRSVDKHGGAEIFRTKINDHPLAAGLAFLICLLPTGVYYEAFGEGEFNSSDFPWIIAFSFQIFIPISLIFHYVINRNKRRLWWEGIVASFSLFAMWMLFGSWSFFYFGFAPMPMWERTTGLLGCFGATGWWLVRVWGDYKKNDIKHRLKETLFIEQENRFIYKGCAADKILSCLPQRNLFTSLHIWLVSFFGPLLGGVLLIFLKTIPQSSGPHALFLIVSFLSFPLSQWILGYLGIRTIYFHIYLPLQIERETGKKVILFP
jgi:hypothetical protein